MTSTRRISKATRSKAKATTKVYRFDARLDGDRKRLIQRAADLEGRSLTDFVLHSATVAAERTIQDRALMILSVRDTESLVTALLEPAAPGAALRSAAARYKAFIGRRARSA